MPTNDDPKPGATPTDATPADSSPPEQDFLLRLQLAAGEVVARYWQAAAWVAGGALVVAGVYGGWTAIRNAAVAADFKDVASVEYKMPRVEPMARFGFAPMDDPTDTTRMANLEEGARRYEAVARTSSGAGAVLAWLRAAEAWERAGKVAESRAALESAAGLEAEGILGFSAEMAATARQFDAGETDAALARWRDIAGRYSGVHAEEALGRLAAAQRTVGREQDAAATEAEITTRFPESRYAKAAPAPVPGAPAPTTDPAPPGVPDVPAQPAAPPAP